MPDTPHSKVLALGSGPAGYHDLMHGETAFSLDHMFGF
jgi:hypothetical protein